MLTQSNFNPACFQYMIDPNPFQNNQRILEEVYLKKNKAKEICPILKSATQSFIRKNLLSVCSLLTPIFAVCNLF